MKKENNLIKVFTGTEVSVILLKGKLEQIGIPAVIRNKYQSGVAASFYAGIPTAIDVYIQETDMNEVEPIIDNLYNSPN
jgi:hypothetical protein